MALLAEARTDSAVIATPEPASATSVPRQYNFAIDILERNLSAGRGSKAAFIDGRGTWSYNTLAQRVDRFAAVLQSLGVQPEQRILICLLDSIDWPTAFLGALRAGVVAVPVNTLLTEDDYRFMLCDSRAKLLVVSDALYAKFGNVIGSCPDLEHIIVAGENTSGHAQFEDLLDRMQANPRAIDTTCADIAFWLYTSGSTGKPKGAVHVHESLKLTHDLYGGPMLGLQESDVCYSVAKLFFAYGLGNALTFPMSVGATTVLLAARPTPESVAAVLRKHPITVFYGVPTFYAAFLASDAVPEPAELKLRRCVSAGEALPSDLGRRWRERYGVDILDGLGSTEMLHIFLSNRPGEVRYGTTGKPVPGYEVRLVDDHGNVITKTGELGELQISGPTSAIMYWNQRERTKNTFQGPWTRSGDKYSFDEHGYYTYGGRSDDMLKVSGIYVSPVEVEAALITHEAVLECAVVGAEDESKLIKPKAYVILKQGHS